MTKPIQPESVEVTQENRDLDVGQVQWHSSEEDGGPDVGILLRLSADHHLWLGELLAAEGDGFGFVLYGPDHERRLFRIEEYDEVRDLFEDYIAPAIRIASTTPTDEAVEASDLAKELLAQSFERSGEQKCAEAVRRGKVAGFGTPLWMDEALFAIRTALHTALTTPTDAAAVEDEREAHDDFTRGYLIAVANIMHTHGEDVIAQDVLSQLGAGEGAIKRLGLCEYDAPVLRKLFREINRKHRNDEQRRARTPREG